MKQILNYSPLKGFNSFKKAYELAKKYRFDNLFIAVCAKPNELLIKGKEPNPYKIYVGISVPKKSFKKAVVRNRIKRLIKVSLRNFIKSNQNNEQLIKTQAILITWNGQQINNPRQIKLTDVEPKLYNAFDIILNKMKKIEANTPSNIKVL